MKAVIVAFVISIVLCISAYAANPGDVVFNELMWMGDFAGKSHEWIELRNTTDADIDLAGWDITRLSDDGEVLMFTIPSGIIPAQGYFLIANNNAEDSNIAVEPDLVETDVSLSNTKLQLRLYDGLFEEGANLIDTADDGTGAPAAGDGQTMKSMVRKDPPGDGTLSENWYTADTQSGWDDDAQEFGTPQSTKGIVEPIPYEVPAVVFSEIMWMGDFAANSHEWLELHNTTDAEIDLSGWQITRLASDGEQEMVTIPAGTIPPDGYFLISNNSADDSNIAVEPDLVIADVSLSNTKLQLKLYDADGNLIDTADDGTGAPAAGDTDAKKSMVRNIPITDGILADSWHTADEQLGWDDDAQEFGTPQSVKGIVEPIPYEVPAVVFSEIMWMGDFAATSHEWIELFNTTDADIDLSGWNITRPGDEGEQEMVIIPMGVIPTAGYFLISNNAAEDSNLAVEPDLVTADVSLSNTKLQLKLYDADGNLIDTADDGTGAPAAGDTDAKKSMVRNIPITDGILADSWHTADEQLGWDDDAQEFGTPQSVKGIVEPIPYEVPAVVFSEIMWMGDFAANSHEWIELFNTTDADIDLSGWQITRFGDEGKQVMVTITMGIIPSGSYFLISNNSAEYSNIAVEPDLVTADISLSNTKLQLKLYDADGNLIDTADDGTGAPAAGDTDAKKTMVRNIPITDGILADSWHTADEQSGWDDDAQEFGTPTPGGLPSIPPWDVNQDGSVDISDLIIVGKYFGESPPTNPRADVDRNNIVDILDLLQIVQHFGESTGVATSSR